MKQRILYIILPMILLSNCNTSHTEAEAIDNICSEVFNDDKPGAAVLITKGDKIVFEKCYGMALMPTFKTSEEGIPVTGETFFNIASVSKQFTAAAILQLCQHGKMSLDDKVSSFFPELVSPIWNDIRIRHLLSHSSGLPDTRSRIYTREQRIYGDDSLAVAFFPTLDSLLFAPGAAYDYKNATYTLLGKVIEKVSGEEFTEYMHRHIFTPAGMGKTLYFDPGHQDLIPNPSHGYKQTDTGGWSKYDYGEETFFATRPDGGIYTSVREFAKWEKALCEGRILDKEWLDKAWTPQIEVSGSPYCDYQNRPNTWYGYGWFIETKAGKPYMIYHTGDNGGYMIMAARYPDSETLILLFSNRNDWDRYGLLKKIEALCIK